MRKCYVFANPEDITQYMMLGCRDKFLTPLIDVKKGQLFTLEDSGDGNLVEDGTIINIALEDAKCTGGTAGIQCTPVFKTIGVQIFKIGYIEGDVTKGINDAADTAFQKYCLARAHKEGTVVVTVGDETWTPREEDLEEFARLWRNAESIVVEGPENVQ